MDTASGTTHWIKQWLKNEDSIIFRACLEKCLHSHFTAGNPRHEEITGLKLLMFQRWKPCKTSHGFQFCCCLELETRVTSTPHSFCSFLFLAAAALSSLCSVTCFQRQRISLVADTLPEVPVLLIQIFFIIWELDWEMNNYIFRSYLRLTTAKIFAFSLVSMSFSSKREQ